MRNTSKHAYRLLHVAFALLALCGVSFIHAQTITTGDVSGVVRDSTGAVIPAATVKLNSTESGESRTVTTNGQGAYHFTLLKPGTYLISASTSGLKSESARVAVEVGQAVTVDLVAQVTTVTEVIEIKGESQILATENANNTTTFTTTQIQDLPMPGGDITTVAFTVPGVVMSTGGYGNFSSHGLPGTANLFTMNGNDYNDPYLNLNNSGASNLLLGQTEIEEASVVQNGYSVQFGRQAGANVNYITKSGGNGIHGDLLYNFNNHLMMANDFFSNANGVPRPYSVSQQWGADIGGPAIKNKLFWYVDSEGIYYTLPTSGVVTVPSQELQTYVLGNIKPIQVPLYQQAFNLWNSAPGLSRAVAVTNGNGLLQDSRGLMGCGELAGTAAPGGGTFGTNVSCLDAFGATGVNTNREWFNTARADWNINDKQKIYFRFKGDHGYQPTGTSLINPVLNEQSLQPQYEGQINHTYIISPNLVNSFTVGFLWYSAIFGPANTAASASAFPTYFGIGGAAGANGGGIYGLGIYWPAFPQGRDSGQGQLIDDFSIIKGNHSIKIGLNYRRNRVTDFSDLEGKYGSYFFSNIVDFANGVTNPNTGSDYYQVFSPLQDTHIRLYNLGVYAMDEWAVKSNLKVTLGIRFDRTANPTCLDDCFSRLTSQFSSSTFQKGADIPYNASIQTGLSTAYYKTDAVVPDPRLGVVWSPKNLGGMVIRGGVGLFSDLAPGFLVSNLFHNAPYPYTANIYEGQEVGLTNDPNSAASAAQNQYNAFKTGFFNGQTLAQLNNSVPGGFGPFGYFSIGQHFKTPQYVEYSFEIEQPIGKKNVLVATYSGNHGYNLLVQNGLVNAYLNNTSQFPNGFGGLPTSAPDPRFSGITELTNGGISNYNGLSIQFRRAFAYGFQGQLSYTWSHALDDVSNGGSGLPFSGSSLTSISQPSIAANYGNADYDVRHNFLADFVWTTPWKLQNKILDMAMNNWTVGGKFFLRSGLPYSIIDGNLAGQVGPNTSATMLASYAAANGVSRSCGTGAVNTACYSLSDFVAAGSETTFGDVSRNSFFGPGYFDIDASLFKNFPIRDRMKLQIGAQAYNLMNHPHFANPNGNVSGGGFGMITGSVIQPTSPYGAFQGSAVSGRVMVVTGRFVF